MLVSDYGKLIQLIVKDQILRSVDKSLAEYLKERDLFKINLNGVITMADNYQAIHGKHPKSSKTSSNVNYKVSSDNVTQQQISTNPSERKCFNCQKSEHISRYCPVKVNMVTPEQVRPKSEPYQVKCFSCKTVGHVFRDCPNRNNNRSNTSDAKVNFALQNGVEYSGSLPVAPGKCNGIDVRVLRDTGTTAVLVKSDLVSPKFMSNENVQLHFADGRSVYTPRATIQLDCAFYRGRTNAACLPDLPCDVLIGNIEGASCACTNINSDLVSCADNHDSSISCFVSTRAQSAAEGRPLPITPSCENPIILDISSVSTKQLISLQLKDHSLKPCFKKTSDLSKTFPKFALRNDVLIRQTIKSKTSHDLVDQVVVPSDLRLKVLKLAHETLMAGHLGTCKTQARLLNHFYWPGVYGDVSRFCRSCEVCQRNSIGRPTKVPLINLPVIDTPFSRVAVDIIGPFPKSSKGNRFALVLIDLATKYPDCVPLKNIDSGSVAEALLEMYCRVGLPNEILHDRGTQFMSAVMRKLNHLLQIKSIATAAYNPKCNGNCENFNKCLKQMIRKITENHPESWDRYLQPLLFAYCEVPQTSTGFSPFELVFSREVRDHLFIIKERILDNDSAEEFSVTSHILEMRKRLREYIKLLAITSTKTCKIIHITYYAGIFDIFFVRR